MAHTFINVERNSVNNGLFTITTFRFLMIVFFIQANCLYSQQLDTAYVSSYDTISEMVKFKKNPLSETKLHLLTNLTGVSNIDYRLHSEVSFSESSLHYRYKPFFMNLEIVGHEFAVHVVSGDISGNGKLVIGDSLPSVGLANLDTAEVLTIALDALDADKYYWQDSTLTAILKEDYQNPDTTHFPHPTLCIFKNLVCYRMMIKCLNPHKTVEFYINANTGDLLKEEEISSACGKGSLHITHEKTMSGSETSLASHKENTRCSCSGQGCQTDGTATLKFYGSQSINTDKFQYLGLCRFRTKDPCSSSFIHMRKANGSDYRNSSNSWGTTDQVATTALWCATQTNEFFLNRFGRVGIDGQGGNIYLFYDNTLENTSIWNGSAIIIGTAGDNATDDVVCLDVIAHEYAHGVNDNSADIPLGSIQEAICDMFGNSVDHFVKNNFLLVIRTIG